jgi:hypothetical protein
MIVKLTNGQLEYPSNFMKVGDNWVSNPTNEQLKSIGFKELIYVEVDELIEQFKETDTQIIAYYLKSSEIEQGEI